ncbi:uncharacterized protein LOC123698760 [Colias croceus]|uniref:uncharacterized protein LOC123698760 n=1 Tax=Colias crocea TaxID=72248 RepID=UPI001E27B499|nr:uncharacterized protein LOC123698760 [Colias croceus]
MNENYQVVPWFNAEEWNEVYKNIFSDQATFDSKEKALKTLFIWKSRCPSLASAIESTLSLLEVHLKDRSDDCDMVDNQLLRLSYSSAIMRFVNHMFDADAAKNNSLYQVAEKRGVPDWIVDLRHDTAHSNNLPALELLRDATSICLRWLKNNYWDIHSKGLRNSVITNEVQMDSITEDQLKVFINFCISLSFSSHPKCNTKNLASMPVDMQQSLVNDAQELFCGKIDLSNLKKVSVNNLMNYIQPYSRNFFKKVIKEDLFDILLSDESYFLSQDIYDVMSKGSKRRGLDKQYVKCFEFLLKLLHTHDMIEDLILRLIKITETKEDKNKCQLAAKWVSAILKALQRSQNFLKAVKEKGLEDTQSKKSKELISLFHHWFPNEKSSPLLLDLCKPVPSSLTDINFIRSIISNYNPFLNYFINDLLQLVKPKLPPLALKQICKLAELIASPEMFPAQSTKIYTVDDLKLVDTPSENGILVCNLDGKESLPNEDEAEDNLIWGIWKKASKSQAWSTCPIGILPWQQTQSVMDID